jgi:hypothetical protein
MKKQKQHQQPKAPPPPKGKKPRKQAIKPTVKEYDARVDEIVDVISQQPNTSRYKLHKMFCTKFNVTWATIDRYLFRARDVLRERLNRSKEEVRCSAVAFYEALISDPKIKAQVRLRAQEALVRLMGADAPARVELSGPQGAPIQTDNKTTGGFDVLLAALTPDELQAIISKLETEEQKDQNEDGGANQG